MKKHFSFLTALLLVVAMLFVSCGETPGGLSDPDNGSGQSSGSGTAEKVFCEKAEGLDNCSAVAKYADLKAVYDEHADATVIIVAKNTADEGRTGWGCGAVFVSTNPNDCYNTMGDKLIEDFKPTKMDATGDTEEINIPLKDIMDKIAEGGALSYNLYNGLVGIKVYAIW